MKICFYIFEDFQLLDLSGPLAAFQMVSFTEHPFPYTLKVCSFQGGMIKCTAGFALESERLDPQQAYDLLLVVGGKGARRIKGSTPEGEAIKTACLNSKQFGSICTGAFVLASLGLLAGKNATTHWKQKRAFAQQYPDVQLSIDSLFVRDGNVWTSAGIISGIDLALAIIEDHLGGDISRKVAQELVVAQRRAGGQTQFSPLLLSEPASSNIRSVLNYIHTHLDADLSVTRLAEIACLSPRQFSRKFTAETGETVARVVERIRVDAAKGMLENGVGNVEKVARLCGFGSTGRMRRAFLKYWDKSSQAFK